MNIERYQKNQYHKTHFRLTGTLSLKIYQRYFVCANESAHILHIRKKAFSGKFRKITGNVREYTAIFVILRKKFKILARAPSAPRRHKQFPRVISCIRKFHSQQFPNVTFSQQKFVILYGIISIPFRKFPQPIFTCNKIYKQFPHV